MQSLDEADITLNRLSGGWRIFQLRRGHRFATDDVLTAWAAWRARPDALRLLDLGAGIGSIGLMTLRMLPRQARLVSVEVQEVSVALARRTAALNGVADRVDQRLGDLREHTVLGAEERFDVITANPPFLPVGAGVRSARPQCEAARFELHGDVFDFCRVAAKHLDQEGRFCLCHAAADPRPEQAVAAAGLRILERREVVFRFGREPRIALYTCGWHGARADAPSLCVRGQDGQRTESFMEVLRNVGIVA